MRVPEQASEQRFIAGVSFVGGEFSGTLSDFRDARDEVAAFAASLGISGLRIVTGPAEEAPPDDPILRVLSTPVEAFIEDTPRSHKGIIGQAFATHGIAEGRDLLILGANRLLEIPNVGDKSIRLIRSHLREQSVPLALRDQTEISDHAALCRDVGSVLMQVLLRPTELPKMGFSGSYHGRVQSEPVNPTSNRLTIQGIMSDSLIFRRIVPARHRPEIRARAQAYIQAWPNHP